MTNTTTIILVAIVFLVIGVALAMAFNRVQQTKRLKERFGPEYERMMNETANKREAEHELAARLARVEGLNIHPLTAEETKRFTRDWEQTQAEFVDGPLTAVQKADRLIREVMSTRGYPMDNFEQRAADISVNYPELVTNYRELHAIAKRSDKEKISTEEMRQAMVHGRVLFHELVQPETATEETTTEKEKI